MEQLLLVKPAKCDRERVLAYLMEFNENGENADGSAGLQKASSYEEWLAALRDNSCEATVRAGLVPASTYLGIRKRDGALVGMVDIRHRLNDALLFSGGHIGYSVRKSERRKGYAAEMLRLALEECRNLHLDKVLLTCNKENIASSRTMLRNGAKLENEVIDGGRLVQRYWIAL